MQGLAEALKENKSLATLNLEVEYLTRRNIGLLLTRIGRIIPLTTIVHES